MLCKYYWIVLYTVHVTTFCLGGPFFSGHGVDIIIIVYFPEAQTVTLKSIHPPEKLLVHV